MKVSHYLFFTISLISFVFILAGCTALTTSTPSGVPVTAPSTLPTTTPPVQVPTPIVATAVGPYPVPSVTSVPTQSAGGNQVVTLQDQGKTITLQPGQRFLLDLGLNYNWTVTVADQAVVSRVVNITVIRGAQGVYEAHQVGQTVLSAVGDPQCRSAQPPCMLPSINFQVTIVVK